MAVFTSNYGTRINTTGITGKPLQRIQSLANSAHGLQAQQIAQRARVMIPKVAQPGNPIDGGGVLPPGHPIDGGGVLPPGQTPPAAFDPSRSQSRIDYLSKVRPNDPQIAILKQRIQNGGAAPPVDVNRITARIAYLTKIRPNDPQIKILQGKLAAGTPPPDTMTRGPAHNLPGQPDAPVPGSTIDGGGAPPDGTAAPADPNLANTQFPSERLFEPQNYQGSPLYQFQVKSGEDQLAKSLAAKGLTGSGSAIQQEINVPLMAAAQDTDRMTQLATANANRLQTYQTNEADRLERAGNNQWDRSFNIAKLLADQSPWAAGLAGLNNTADLTKGLGDAQANYLKDAYGRVIAVRSSPGQAFTPIPTPSGPNYSNITPAQIAGGQSSNNGWLNVLTNGLAGFFQNQ
jgi:hypothetical protein